MRFGLVGTGFWATVTHGTALAEAAAGPASEVEFVALWGRDPARRDACAARFGVRSSASFAEMLDDVDAVAFAVPPDVQVELAIQAAEAGKHLLLEKPIATSLASADRLVAAVDANRVASVVFFTARFDPGQRRWVEDAAALGWQGAWARWIVSAFAPGSPYATSSWRRDKGALWDVGPHALSLLSPLLGPVVDVVATGGAADLVHLVLEHEGGATSTASLTLGAPTVALSVELTVWGPEGLSSLPAGESSQVPAFRSALDGLVSSAAGERVHPCDARFGRYVVEVLTRAEQQLQGR